MGIHKWSKWTFGSGYIDISWGDRVPSSTLVRACARCGMAKSKSKYGLNSSVAKRLYPEAQ